MSCLHNMQIHTVFLKKKKRDFALKMHTVAYEPHQKANFKCKIDNKKTR